MDDYPKIPEDKPITIILTTETQALKSTVTGKEGRLDVRVNSTAVERTARGRSVERRSSH